LSHTQHSRTPVIRSYHEFILPKFILPKTAVSTLIKILKVSNTIINTEQSVIKVIIKFNYS